MKNAIIFVPTTSLNRGLKRLAPLQGGLFLFHCKRVFSYKAAACLYRALRSVMSAKVVLSAVSGGPLFCLPTNDNTTHDSSTSRPPRQDRRAAIRIQRQPGGAKAIARTGKRPGNSAKFRDHRSQGANIEARNAFQAVIDPINTFFHSFQPSVAAAG